jgi:serine/threonine protein kinase
MDAMKTCPNCHKPLASNAPDGLCPECLVKAGLPTGVDITDPTGPHGTRVTKPPPPLDEIARHFPQFEILECLGRGGMGVVYKARQPKLNRIVALKILAPEKVAEPKFAERFEREAQALARLNHPNIVTVYDFGETGGLYYLTMEFVDGASLRQLLQTRKIAPEEALAIVPKICEALQFAHDKGVVHRDIKPENVLVDRSGQVKIADFGIAKIVGETPFGVPPSGGPGAASSDRLKPELRTNLTADQVLGTPNYMAPEQVEHPQTVDHRADIYSLGVVFYEMLTGEVPGAKIQPPSKKVQLDVRIDEIVMRALEQEPELRYQTAADFRTQVETFATTSADAVKAQKPSATIPPSAIPSAGATVDLAEARRQVRWPATGLLVTALLSPFLPGLMSLAGRLEIGAWFLWPFVFVLAGTAVAAFGALRMRRLESYRGAVAGGIAGCLISFFNLFCLPFAVWSLAVLARREVREAFAAKRDGRITPPDSPPQAKSAHHDVARRVRWLWTKAGFFFFAAVCALVSAVWSADVTSPLSALAACGFGLWGYRQAHAAKVLVSGAAEMSEAKKGIITALAIVGAVAAAVSLVVRVSTDRMHAKSVPGINTYPPTATDSGRVVRVEGKLRHEIEKRMSEAGWRLEGLSVSVTPDLRRAECSFAKALEKEAYRTVGFSGEIRIKSQGENLWLVTGENEFRWLRFSVDTSAETADRKLEPVSPDDYRYEPVQEFKYEAP